MSAPWGQIAFTTEWRLIGGPDLFAVLGSGSKKKCRNFLANGLGIRVGGIETGQGDAFELQ
jgi:hypothetical protein